MVAFRRLVFQLTVVSLALLCACGGGDDDDQVPTVAAEDTVSGASQRGGATQRPGASPSPSTSRTVHACDLITPEEVSAAVGFTVGPGRDYLAAARGATQCEWAGPGVVAPVVYAEVLTKGGENWFKAIHIPNAALPEVEIPGLGDKAFYSNDLNTVDVVSGDRYISLQLIGARSAGVDEQTAGAALAQALLAKLQ